MNKIKQVTFVLILLVKLIKSRPIDFKEKDGNHDEDELDSVDINSFVVKHINQDQLYSNSLTMSEMIYMLLISTIALYIPYSKIIGNLFEFSHSILYKAGNVMFDNFGPKEEVRFVMPNEELSIPEYNFTDDNSWNLFEIISYNWKLTILVVIVLMLILYCCCCMGGRVSSSKKSLVKGDKQKEVKQDESQTNVEQTGTNIEQEAAKVKEKDKARRSTLFMRIVSGIYKFILKIYLFVCKLFVSKRKHETMETSTTTNSTTTNLETINTNNNNSTNELLSTVDNTNSQISNTTTVSQSTTMEGTTSQQMSQQMSQLMPVNSVSNGEPISSMAPPIVPFIPEPNAEPKPESKKKKRKKKTKSPRRNKEAEQFMMQNNVNN